MKFREIAEICNLLWLSKPKLWGQWKNIFQLPLSFHLPVFYTNSTFITIPNVTFLAMWIHLSTGIPGLVKWWWRYLCSAAINSTTLNWQAISYNPSTAFYYIRFRQNTKQVTHNSDTDIVYLGKHITLSDTC